MYRWEQEVWHTAGEKCMKSSNAQI
jgi:hypothetical protein